MLGLKSVEVTLAWLLKNSRAHDDKAFYTAPAFANHKEQSIKVTSPDCGETNAKLSVVYTADGVGKIPTLEWTAPDAIKDSVKEWLVFTEDPDAPLPTPICHGIYGGIKPEKMRLEPQDLEIQDESQAFLKGGFYYDFFEVVALSEPLDKELLKAKINREQAAEAVNGKVLGWGLWVGSCERKWT